MKKQPITMILAGFGMAMGAFLLWPSPIDPAGWNPPRFAGVWGASKPNTILSHVERLALSRVHASEDVLPAKDGGMCASDGERIVRLSADGRTLKTIASLGGQNLGLAWVDARTLAVANQPKGLFLLDVLTGALRRLAVGNIHYPNGIAVSSDGKMLYFTDSSDKYYGEPWKYMYDLLEARPHGRLYSLDLTTNRLTLLMDGLFYPNGIAISPQGDALLLNETYRYRIRRYWLKGPKSGSSDLFVENLPGFPDGLSRDEETGHYWVALFTPRNDTADWLHRHPFLKSQLAKLPPFLWPRPRLYGMVLVVSPEGKPVARYEDPSGTINTLSSARKVGSMLYLGSLKGGFIGRLNLKAEDLKQEAP
jgi:sugar lactone lactonase YvrE